MPSALDELDGLSFSFGEIQPVSRINNELHSRAYLPGSIYTENDAASPGETETSLFVWNTATASSSPPLSASATAHSNFTPIESFPLNGGRLRHHFGTDSVRKHDKKHESTVGKKPSRLRALGKSRTYWIGLSALALLVALTSTVDPLRAKLLRAGFEWARSDNSSLQLSWDDDFLPRMPNRLKIRASRSPEASKSPQSSFSTESEGETHHRPRNGTFDRDGVLFDESARRPNKASFSPVTYTESYKPILSSSSANSRQELDRSEPSYASKYETRRRSGTPEAREGTIQKWRRYSPVPSRYYGYSREREDDYPVDRGSGYSTPLDSFMDDIPSSGTDGRLDMRRSHSGSDSSSSYSGGERTGLRQSRNERRRTSTSQNRQRSSVLHRSQRRGNDVVEAPSKGHRRRTKISRRSRVSTDPPTEKQAAQSAFKRRWQRGRRSVRSSFARRNPREPSVSVASQGQPSKKNRFFLPESNVASGDASGEDDDSDEQEAHTHPAVPGGATGARSQRADSASASASTNNGNESLDGARTSSLPRQSSQSALPPSSTMAGQEKLAVTTAARLLETGVAPNVSFKQRKKQASSGSSSASSLPTEVLLYLVRQALEELVSSDNESDESQLQ
ncbi:hypothetical protein, conserved [Eimeria brunetti]|uniref:Uncharacterized protein n=1 Tax=Eimeria brunetti TaxID=51314 RepID=U6LLS4_9EIME|nr:hypothetical protein, conserved [Eimeria brunetti]